MNAAAADEEVGIYVQRTEQYTPPPEQPAACTAEASAETAGAAAEGAREVDDARRMSGRSSSRLSDISDSVDLCSNHDGAEDIMKKAATASGAAPASAAQQPHAQSQKQQQQSPSTSASPGTSTPSPSHQRPSPGSRASSRQHPARGGGGGSNRALSRAHPAFARKSKNALSAIAGGTDARQSSFQLPPKPGTAAATFARSRTASSDNGSGSQRNNGGANSSDEPGRTARARRRDSHPSLGMASSYSSRDYSGTDHPPPSGTNTSATNASQRSSNVTSSQGQPPHPHLQYAGHPQQQQAGAPTPRAGEWLRLRPRAQRQTMPSQAYMQHSEAYHDQGGHSSDNMSNGGGGGGGGGGHTHGHGAAFGRGGQHHHLPPHQYGEHQQHHGQRTVNSSAYLAHGGRAFNPRQIFFPASAVPGPLANAAHLRLDDSRHDTVERPVWRSVGPEVQQQYAMHGEDVIGEDDDDDEDDDDRTRSSDDSSSIDEERPRRRRSSNKKKKKAKTDALMSAKQEEEDEAARALEAAVQEGRKKAETATDDEKAPTPDIIPVATDGEGAIVAGAMDPRQMTPLASISPWASDSVSAITDSLSALTQQLDTDTENEMSDVGEQMTPAERQQYRAMLYAQHYAALAAQAQAQAQARAQAAAQGGDLQGIQQSTAAGAYAVHPHAQALGISAATAQLQQQQLYALENPDVEQMMAYQQAQATYLAQQAQYAEWIAQQQQLMMQQQQQQQQVETSLTHERQHQAATSVAAQQVHEEAVDAVPAPPPEDLNRNVSGGKHSVVSSAAFSAQPTVQARGGGGHIVYEDGIEEEGESSSENGYEDEPEAILPNDEKIRSDGIAYRRPKSDDDDDGGGGATYPSNVAEMYEMQSAGAYHLASPDSKYEIYACRVDVTQGDRSTEISLFSAARPHMRGFHFSWLGFFCAFLAWFAIAPLLPEIQRSLHLSRDQIWNSSICSVAAGVVFRVLAGPLSDKYGARWIMGIFLVCAGVPCMCTGFVNSGPGLSVLRTIIGIGGATFVPMQYWTSSMFTREVAGTANSLAAGWGNLGGGITQILIGSILLPLFKVIYGETDPSQPANKSWRTVCVVPGLMCCVVAFCLIRYSDDCPKGNYRKRERLGLMPSVSAGKSLREASLDRNAWLLIVQYACCFGVELTMSNAAVLYFTEEFGLPIERASAIASVSSISKAHIHFICFVLNHHTFRSSTLPFARLISHEHSNNLL